MSSFSEILTQLFEQHSFPEDAFFIDRVLAGRKIVVYGAGSGFHWFEEVVMERYGYKASAIIDKRFSRGDMFSGIPAFSPLDYQPSEDEKENAVAVICIGKRELFPEIQECLKTMGFKHVILSFDIYELHNPFGLPKDLNTMGVSYYLQLREPILSCLEIFADDESREVYTRCLQTHLTRKPVFIPSRAPGEQYTPSDIQLKQGYSRYIYCGVSSGEMARVLNEIGTMNHFVCFEPNAHQFEKLVDYFLTHKKQVAGNVVAYPCAVYSREAQMPFIYTDDSFGNRISWDGQFRVQCVSIDHVIPGFSPTFISMDIEGSELEALKGAEMSIRASRPDLAICVYHAPNQLWEIPLFLHNLGLGYRFYLRNYTGFVGETVLYGTV